MSQSRKILSCILASILYIILVSCVSTPKNEEPLTVSFKIVVDELSVSIANNSNEPFSYSSNGDQQWRLIIIVKTGGPYPNGAYNLEYGKSSIFIKPGENITFNYKLEKLVFNGPYDDEEGVFFPKKYAGMMFQDTWKSISEESKLEHKPEWEWLVELTLYQYQNQEKRISSNKKTLAELLKEPQKQIK